MTARNPTDHAAMTEVADRLDEPLRGRALAALGELLSEVSGNGAPDRAVARTYARMTEVSLAWVRNPTTGMRGEISLIRSPRVPTAWRVKMTIIGGPSRDYPLEADLDPVAAGLRSGALEFYPDQVAEVLGAMRPAAIV